jgi:hypothetical protein
MGAPHRPIKPRRLLQLVYSGPPIIKTAAEVLAIIRQRTADILTEAELALVIRPLALPPPESQPAAAQPKPAKKPRPAARSRGQGGRFAPRQG